MPHTPSFLFFFFNDTATTEIYTLSLHDPLPISTRPQRPFLDSMDFPEANQKLHPIRDQFLVRFYNWSTEFSRREFCRKHQKSTHLESQHLGTFYCVLFFKKKKQPADVPYCQHHS